MTIVIGAEESEVHLYRIILQGKDGTPPIVVHINKSLVKRNRSRHKLTEPSQSVVDGIQFDDNQVKIKVSMHYIQNILSRLE
jgi:hypothetical protein